MNIEEFAYNYDKLSRQMQARFLANLAHQLTLSIRGCYSNYAQIVNCNLHSKVGNINEIQHRVIGFLRDILFDEVERASGIEIMNNLYGWAENGHVEEDLLYSLKTAMEFIKNEA